MDQSKFKGSDIIYKLLIDDVQSVSLEETGRELNDSEIESILDDLAANVNWYEAICQAINNKIVV